MHVDPQQVKADSMALLRSWGVPVIEHLPTLEEIGDLSPPSPGDVARRCMILNHVIGIGFGGDASKLKEAAIKFGLWPSASQRERELLSRCTHTPQEKTDATWMVENVQSLAFCLGLAELSHFQRCDDNLASHFPRPFTDPSNFIASATLRPFEEIYRQADLHYRLHWAARNSRLTGVDYPVTEGFIRERRKALDWVLGVEADWDEVPSDT